MDVDHGSLPDDPFPNLTLIDLDQLMPSPDLLPLKVWQQLFPTDRLVVLAEVVERTDEGAPRLVRIVP